MTAAAKLAKIIIGDPKIRKAVEAMVAKAAQEPVQVQPQLITPELKKVLTALENAGVILVMDNWEAKPFGTVQQ